jgi:hypothetical protein
LFPFIFISNTIRKAALFLAAPNTLFFHTLFLGARSSRFAGDASLAHLRHSWCWRSGAGSNEYKREEEESGKRRRTQKPLHGHGMDQQCLVEQKL